MLPYEVEINNQIMVKDDLLMQRQFHNSLLDQTLQCISFQEARDSPDDEHLDGSHLTDDLGWRSTTFC